MQPYPIDLSTDAGYLSLLTRKIFHSGFKAEIVDRKWDAFDDEFYGFDPECVAAMTAEDIDELSRNPALIRNSRKLNAVVANATSFVAVANTHGSWKQWLESLRLLTYEEVADTLRATLTQVGPSTLFWFLLEAGEVTPDDRPDYVRPGERRGALMPS